MLVRILYAVLAFIILMVVLHYVPILASYATVIALIVAILVFLGAERL
jgi:hypothetical protein